MVTIQNTNATILERELNWFRKILESRVRAYTEKCRSEPDLLRVDPPRYNDSEKTSPYLRFLEHYDVGNAERLLLLLALIPHICPQLLDLFWIRNEKTDRGYTEFGGLKASSHGGFLPTGETALFILAGTDLQKRFALMDLFDPEHYFASHHILKLQTPDGEPLLSGSLQLSPEYIERFTTGQTSRPDFSFHFPAKRITTSLDWEDLILPEKTREQVHEIQSWIRHASTIMVDWDLQKRLSPGYKSLFYGPPGTGKTLTACLIGKQCRMDVYRVDLSMMISKYIGETEKNLSRIFDAAENKNWILFFDEADALFGKRTSIQDSHDRYANQEVSYLLQRMEEFNGVVLLATNMKMNLDEAFLRRFQSMIYFPVPDSGLRYQLWSGAFPSKVSREESIDLKQIASRYELTGGSIMNVIRYTALMAAQREEKMIRLDDVVCGIRNEYQKEGKTA